MMKSQTALIKLIVAIVFWLCLFCLWIKPTHILWKRVSANADWSIRDSMGEAVFRQQMWLLGGWTPRCVSEVWTSKDGSKWNLVGIAPWIGRNLLSALVFHNELWVLGGLDYSKQVSFSDVWYTSDGAKWTLANRKAPWGNRGAVGSVVFNDRMWVLGGFSLPTFQHFNDIWESSNGVDWTRVTTHAPWPERAMHGCVVFKDQMWVLGGGIYDPHYFLHGRLSYSDVWTSRDGKNWQLVTNAAPWGPRRFLGSVVYNDKIWVIAGINTKNLDDIWSSPDGKTWKQEKSAFPHWTTRHEPSCLVFQDRLWVMGGYGRILYDDIWVYDAHRFDFWNRLKNSISWFWKYPVGPDPVPAETASQYAQNHSEQIIN